MTTQDQWLGIELRHLAALQAVAREGSFRAAAAELGYVPSAISSQIAALEKAVGARLVDRSRGTGAVGLTEAGEVLLAHTESILARLQAAQADVERFLGGARQALRVGITQSVGIRVLPELMQRFADHWPNVQLLPVESESDLSLYELVERGELELTFGELPTPEGPFEAIKLLTDPYVLVVRADSELAQSGRAAGVEDIAGLPLIGYHQCRGLRRVETQLAMHGAQANFVCRSDVNATVQALVAAGVGAAILPRLGVDRDDARSRIVPLGPALGAPQRVLAAVWHRDRIHSKAARDFVKLARELCAEIEKHDNESDLVTGAAAG